MTRYFTVRHRDHLGRVREAFNVLHGVVAEDEEIVAQTHRYSPAEVAAIIRAKAREEQEREAEGMAAAFAAVARARGRRDPDSAAKARHHERLVRRRIAAMHSER